MNYIIRDITLSEATDIPLNKDVQQIVKTFRDVFKLSKLKMGSDRYGNGGVHIRYMINNIIFIARQENLFIIYPVFSQKIIDILGSIEGDSYITYKNFNFLTEIFNYFIRKEFNNNKCVSVIINTERNYMNA
tara:strand:- start:611 stop:1006 length:396 start_codon:yes stop_codon:yes gene_type:complete